MVRQGDDVSIVGVGRVVHRGQQDRVLPAAHADAARAHDPAALVEDFSGQSPEVG